MRYKFFDNSRKVTVELADYDSIHKVLKELGYDTYSTSWQGEHWVRYNKSGDVLEGGILSEITDAL
jgi:hypothetical protein